MARRVPYAAQAARERYLATDAQLSYLRRLLDLAFARRVDLNLGLDRHHLEGTTRAYASESITRLKALLEARHV